MNEAIKLDKSWWFLAFLLNGLLCPLSFGPPNTDVTLSRCPFHQLVLGAQPRTPSVITPLSDRPEAAERVAQLEILANQRQLTPQEYKELAGTLLSSSDHVALNKQHRDRFRWVPNRRWTSWFGLRYASVPPARNQISSTEQELTFPNGTRYSIMGRGRNHLIIGVPFHQLLMWQGGYHFEPWKARDLTNSQEVARFRQQGFSVRLFQDGSFLLSGNQHHRVVAYALTYRPEGSLNTVQNLFDGTGSVLIPVRVSAHGDGHFYAEPVTAMGNSPYTVWEMITERG